MGAQNYERARGEGREAKGKRQTANGLRSEDLSYILRRSKATIISMTAAVPQWIRMIGVKIH